MEKESKVLDRAQTTNSFPPLSKDVSLNSINLMAPQFPALRSSNRVPLISPPPFLPPFHQLHFHHGLEINVRIDQKRKRSNNLVFNSSPFVIPNLRCISAIFISFEQFLSYLETTHCAYAWNLILVIYNTLSFNITLDSQIFDRDIYSSFPRKKCISITLLIDHR